MQFLHPMLLSNYFSCSFFIFLCSHNKNTSNAYGFTKLLCQFHLSTRLEDEMHIGISQIYIHPLKPPSPANNFVHAQQIFNGCSFFVFVDHCIYFTIENTQFLNPPVLMHGGLLCIALHLSVCHLTKNQTRKKFISQRILQLGVWKKPHHEFIFVCFCQKGGSNQRQVGSYQRQVASLSIKF